MRTTCTPDIGRPKVFEFEFLAGDADTAETTLGLTIPANSLYRAQLKVVDAFDSGTSDELTVGAESDGGELVNEADLQTEGIKTAVEGWTDDALPLFYAIATVGEAATHGRAKLAIEIKTLS